MRYWTCQLCNSEHVSGGQKRADESRGICPTCVEEEKADINKQDGPWIVKAEIMTFETEHGIDIEKKSFGPFTNIDNAEKCVLSLSGRENVFSAKVEHIK